MSPDPFSPSKFNIERQLELVLGLAEENNLVLVSFSGQGVHFDGTSYRCPVDAQLYQPKQIMISLELVFNNLSELSAALKLMLVDACRDDPRLAGSRNLGKSQRPLRSLGLRIDLPRTPKSIHNPSTTNELYSCPPWRCEIPTAALQDLTCRGRTVLRQSLDTNSYRNLAVALSSVIEQLSTQSA